LGEFLQQIARLSWNRCTRKWGRGWIFLVIDEWQSEAAFNEFVKSRKVDYDLLEEKAKAASRTKKRIWISLNLED